MQPHKNHLLDTPFSFKSGTRTPSQNPHRPFSRRTRKSNQSPKPKGHEHQAICGAGALPEEESTDADGVARDVATGGVPLKA